MHVIVCQLLSAVAEKVYSWLACMHTHTHTHTHTRTHTRTHTHAHTHTDYHNYSTPPGRCPLRNPVCGLIPEGVITELIDQITEIYIKTIPY